MKSFVLKLQNIGYNELFVCLFLSATQSKKKKIVKSNKHCPAILVMFYQQKNAQDL